MYIGGERGGHLVAGNTKGYRGFDKGHKEQQDEIIELKRITDSHERDIKDIKDTLKDIKEDTKWLRWSITNAIITAAIGGVIAIVFAVFKGGM